MPFTVRDTIPHDGKTFQRGDVVDDATGDAMRNAGHGHSLSRVDASHPSAPVKPEPAKTGAVVKVDVQ